MATRSAAMATFEMRDRLHRGTLGCMPAQTIDGHRAKSPRHFRRKTRSPFWNQDSPAGWACLSAGDTALTVWAMRASCRPHRHGDILEGTRSAMGRTIRQFARSPDLFRDPVPDRAIITPSRSSEGRSIDRSAGSAVYRSTTAAPPAMHQDAPSAARTRASASGEAQAAGPFRMAISQPASSTRSVVGRPTTWPERWRTCSSLPVGSA